jgi:hypothetical protein
MREVGRQPLISDVRLLSDEGTEYVSRGTAHSKGTPWGTGGPTRSSSGRSGAACELTRGARGVFKASRARGGLGKARDLGRRAARMPRVAGVGDSPEGPLKQLGNPA